MKSVKYNIIISVIVLFGISQSCKKTDLLPDLKGSMVGYVYTFDEFSQLLDDHSKVLISALGNQKTYQVFSDKNGRFEFENLPAGTYELHFEKQGFGILKQFGIQHLGGEPTVLGMLFGHDSNGSAFFIYELSTTEITLLNIENHNIYCNCSFSKQAPENLGIQLYFSMVDNFDIQSAQFVIPSERLQKDSAGYVAQESFSLPYKQGDKVYYRACPAPLYGSAIGMFNHRFIFGIDSYFDYGIHQVVYPALGKVSAQYSFIVGK